MKLFIHIARTAIPLVLFIGGCQSHDKHNALDLPQRISVAVGQLADVLEKSDDLGEAEVKAATKEKVDQVMVLMEDYVRAPRSGVPIRQLSEADGMDIVGNYMRSSIKEDERMESAGSVFELACPQHDGVSPSRLRPTVLYYAHGVTLARKNVQVRKPAPERPAAETLVWIPESYLILLFDDHHRTLCRESARVSADLK